MAQYHPRIALVAAALIPAALALGLIIGVCPVQAAPKPALVPPPGTWQFDLQLHGQPRRITVTLAGDTEPQTFWYVPYTITNNANQDAEFYPRVELLTDTLKLYRAGVNARRPIFQAIRRRYLESLPLLEPQSMLTGRILQGDDNARDSVIILQDFDPNATSVSIFFTGLSNETQTVEHPTRVDPKTHKPKQLLLRKTLMLKYDVPGDAIKPEKRVMLYRNREWIMR